MMFTASPRGGLGDSGGSGSGGGEGGGEGGSVGGSGAGGRGSNHEHCWRGTRGRGARSCGDALALATVRSARAGEGGAARRSVEAHRVSARPGPVRRARVGRRWCCRRRTCDACAIGVVGIATPHGSLAVGIRPAAAPGGAVSSDGARGARRQTGAVVGPLRRAPVLHQHRCPCRCRQRGRRRRSDGAACLAPIPFRLDGDVSTVPKRLRIRPARVGGDVGPLEHAVGE
eukprot:scaffold50679_cov71-Phaeocystis_antarctica.AAC.4